MNPAGRVSVTLPAVPKLEAVIVTVNVSPLSTVEGEKDLVAPVLPAGIVGTSVGSAVGSSVGIAPAVTVISVSPPVVSLFLLESPTVPLNV